MAQPPVIEQTLGQAVRLGAVCAAVLLYASGCHFGGPQEPSAGWLVQEAPPALTRMERAGQPVLRILTCYAPLMSDHAATWLGLPDQQWLIWDPGGALGKNEEGYRRSSDLVLGRPLNLDDYWQWRQEISDSVGFEVFEWDLDPPQAELMGKTLRGENGFDTATRPGFCCVKVCEFLQSVGGGVVQVSKRYALPSTLSRYLWASAPDRVIVYRLGTGPKLFTHASPGHAAKSEVD